MPPTCMTPKLEYLQVKWAADLSYATATTLLGDVLPSAVIISLKRSVIGAALKQNDVQHNETTVG